VIHWCAALAYQYKVFKIPFRSFSKSVWVTRLHPTSSH
jgi:hypothetical protein